MALFNNRDLITEAVQELSMKGICRMFLHFTQWLQGSLPRAR